MPRFCLIIIIFLFLMPFQAFANVIINEIAWMGTEASYNDEWLELYNNSGLVVNLDGWILRAVDGTPEIELSGTILSQGFYLLERTNDDTIPGVMANQIYTGALENSGEKLELFDNFGNLSDFVDCSNGWIGGDNQTKQTMERTRQNTWQTSQGPGGTPKDENSALEEISKVEPLSKLESKPELTSVPESEPVLEPEPKPETPSPGATEIKTYQSGIVINEILPSPEGPDKTEEWIEIKNLNNGMVDISGWKIQDTVGATKTHLFPEGTKIPGLGFLVLKRPETKITLNNSGDGLKLLQPNDNLVDEASFTKAPLGQSYNRIESNWVWSDNLTPGLENIIPKITKKEPLATPSNTIRGEEKPLTIDLKKEGKAAIGEPFSKKPSPHFLIAILLAVFSGILILFLKKKLQKGIGN